MNTSDLTADILLAASSIGCRLFRNNSGIATFNKKDASGKKKTWSVLYGVGPSEGGGGDLIGWTSTGRFASIEIKVGRDTQSEAQKKWERWVISGGGVAGVARSVEDAIAILQS